MTRTQFMDEHPELLHPAVTPIYDHGGIVVRQDPTWPVPGFFIVSARRHHASIDQMPEAMHLRMAAIIRHVRAGLRERLHVNQVQSHYEEKNSAAYEVHHWLLPIYPEYAEGISATSTNDQLRFNLGRYLRSFTYFEQSSRLIAAQTTIQGYLERIGLEQLDDRLIHTLHGSQVVDNHSDTFNLGPV